MSYILDALRKSEQERQRGKLPDLNSYKDEPATSGNRRNLWPWITGGVVLVNLAVAGFLWSPAKEPAPVAAANTAGESAPASRPASVAMVPATAAPATQPISQPAPMQPATQPYYPPAPQPYGQPAPQQMPPQMQAQAAPPQYQQQYPQQYPPQYNQQPQPYAQQYPQQHGGQPMQVPDTAMMDSRPQIQPQPTYVSPQTPEPGNDYEEPFQSAPAPNVAYMPQLEELPSYERANIPDMTFSSHMYSSVPRFRSIIINGKRLKEGEYFTDNLQVREITEKGVIMSTGNQLFAVDVLGRWAQ